MTDGFNSSGSSGKYEDRIMDHGERLSALEERTKHLASKEDLQKAMNAQTWKIIAAIAALVSAVYWIATH
jgi:hypothetical protein